MEKYYKFTLRIYFVVYKVSEHLVKYSVRCAINFHIAMFQCHVTLISDQISISLSLSLPLSLSVLSSLCNPC